MNLESPSFTVKTAYDADLGNKCALIANANSILGYIGSQFLRLEGRMAGNKLKWGVNKELLVLIMNEGRTGKALE